MAKSQWGKDFRKSLIISLSSVLLVALTFVNSCTTEISGPEYQEIIEIEDIEITKQQLEEARPPTKEVDAEVIEADDDEVDPELTIKENLLTENYEPSLPVEELIDTVSFVLLEKPPKAIKQVNPRYPDLARKGGVEGKVLVEVLIDLNGEVESARVIKASPENFFDEAALEAARQWEFSPATQRDKPVKVLYQIPFNFRLR